MPAQAQGSRRQPPGLLSFSSGSLERGAGAGERAERTWGCSARPSRSVGEARLTPRQSARRRSPSPRRGGRRNPGFSSWFFCLLQNSRASGAGL